MRKDDYTLLFLGVLVIAAMTFMVAHTVHFSYKVEMEKYKADQARFNMEIMRADRGYRESAGNSKAKP